MNKVENTNADFCILNGSGRVMVSAPHCTEQTRLGKIKEAEPQTLTLALMLHDELDCPIIYKTENVGDDANYDKNSPYKNALRDFVISNGIKFLIDLHQLSPARKVQIDLGTGNFKNVSVKNTNIFLGAFSNRKIGLIQIDAPFAAAQPYTVSSYIRKTCDIECIQIEINSDLLFGESAKHRYDEVFAALKNSIIRLNKNGV